MSTVASAAEPIRECSPSSDAAPRPRSSTIWRKAPWTRLATLVRHTPLQPYLPSFPNRLASSLMQTLTCCLSLPPSSQRDGRLHRRPGYQAEKVWGYEGRGWGGDVIGINKKRDQRPDLPLARGDAGEVSFVLYPDRNMMVDRN